MLLRRLPPPRPFESLLSAMLYQWAQTPDRPSAVIALTARQHGEGISTITAGLARAASSAGSGRVLAVDTVGGQGGLAEILKQVSVSDAEPREEIAGVAPLGSRLVPGVDVLSADDDIGVEGCLEAASRTYSLTLVDAGALAVPSSARWLSASDRRVLIIDVRRSNLEVLASQRHLCCGGKLAIDATILNRRTYAVPGWLYRLLR